MGYYFRCDRDRGLTGDLCPTITAGEYVSAFSSVIRILAGSSERRRHRDQEGLRSLRVASVNHAARVLSDLVLRDPNDQSAHRLLGIARLCQGNLMAAVKHLEIALGLLRREAAIRVNLCDTLRVQCEASLLRLVLVPLYIKVGRHEAAHSLLKEGQML